MKQKNLDSTNEDDRKLFEDEINYISEYQNKTKFWSFKVPEAPDLFLTLTLYQHQNTEDLDCIPVYIPPTPLIPSDQTAKLLYGGTTLLQGKICICPLKSVLTVVKPLV